MTNQSTILKAKLYDKILKNYDKLNEQGLKVVVYLLIDLLKFQDEIQNEIQNRINKIECKEDKNGIL